ncbi:MAG: PDZ domain-containing protein [Candidatus Brocadiae bacterium]|nr:PDZ domain-containing protein [Candidatus Brocadiia bacterium]
MRRVLSAVLSLVLCLPLFAEPSLSKSSEKAREYLNEVQKHLTESYIEREKVKGADVFEACRAGLLKSLEDDALKGADAALKSELAEIFQDAKLTTVDALIRKVRKCAEKHGAKDLDVIRMADLAAQSMVQSIGDPFSNLLKGEDMQKLMKQMQGEGKSDSIGIGVEPGADGMKVSFVMYGYAGYDAGLRVGDRVTEVDGEKVAGLGMKDLQTKMVVKEGESVVLTVTRDGWKKPYDITVLNSPRKIRNVWATMLPGGIGYVRLTIFDLQLGGSTLDALKKLKKDGMTKIVLDLRNNPGGALPSAVAVADTFIAGDRLITYTESNLDLSGSAPFPIPGLADQKPEMSYRAGRKSDFEGMPMVVLVNGSSASASEMLSGALQDLGRAVVVGETTYGKGIGQTAIPLWKATGSEFGKAFMPMLPNRFLYLTVMKYSLPSGRSIHHSGVVPDVKVVNPQMDGAAWDGVYAVRKGGKVKAYAESLDKELAADLAVYDGFDTNAYPGFERVYRSLRTKLSKDQVREEIRREVRLRVGGEVLLVDMQTDVQLQRAVMLLGREMDGAGNR